MKITTPPPVGHIRIISEQVLSDDWYLLRKITFDYRRRDGSWQQQAREVYDRGNGAVVLLYNAARGTVLLTRQFRLPAYVNGSADGFLIQREAAEETGFRIAAPRKVFEAYMSPGSVTERLHFFVAEYEEQDRVSEGGGDVNEGEEIETLDLPLSKAVQMIDSGTIQDGKTIMLLQYAQRMGLHALGRLE